MLDESPSASSEVPARIAILAVRARANPPSGTFLLNENPEPLSFDAVAQRLAQMPKPLSVSVISDGERLHIHAALVREDSITKKLYDSLQESYASQGGAVGFLTRRYEGDVSDLIVLCTAGREVVRVREVREWQRDYCVERCGYAADFPDSPFGLGLGVSEADLSGVAAVIAFSSGGGSWTSSVNGVADMRGWH